MIELPDSFRRRVLEELGTDEGERFCEALDSASPTSVRLHPARTGRWADAERVAWCAAGRYLAERPSFTLDPAFHAGAYYVQEASSQFVGHLLAEEPIEGARLLDLCAAPGGKTTLYASLVGADGLVVANEINRQRAAVLADNVRKWGTGNVAVTTCEPAKVAAFEEWFDVVAVDAPCSGEGMFRKMPEAREEWSEGNVQLCARRQGEILREAWRTLRPGGLLIYSTCTFNRLENESSLEELLAWTSDEVTEAAPIKCPAEWGVVCGRVGAFQTFRFYPHRLSGEGFFAAVARKSGTGRVSHRAPKARRDPFAAVDRTSQKELARWVLEPEEMRFALIGESCYAYRASQTEAVRQLAGVLPVIYSGVEMGRLFKGRLKPEHPLALYVGLNRKAVPTAEVDEATALSYLRRGEIAAAGLEEGVNLLCCEGLPIGFAKRIGNRVNNMYPNSLRILNL